MSKSITTLEDIFEILEVDPDGKKFDKGWSVNLQATVVAPHPANIRRLLLLLIQSYSFCS